MITFTTALVTGGASGLGKAIAQRLKEAGLHVVITDVDRDLGEGTAAQCGLDFLHQDVSDERRWEELIRSVEERHGHLDVLVNNAGILGPVDRVNPENTSYADWKRIFQINLDGVFLGCRAAIPAMRRAGGGSIVNISSVAGLTATPYATAYGASKAAVRHLTKSIAQHCAQERLNIRCNSVHPGDVRTTLWEVHARAAASSRGVSLERYVADVERQIPLGKLARPDDVAAAVAFLSSDDARHITGEQLIVDGGFVHCDTFHCGNH